jgi:hypothetical protein
MQRVLAALLIAGCGGSSGGHPDGTVSTRCHSEADCAAPTPICEPATGTCVECRFSSHCRCCATCPTFGNAYWTDEPHPMQNYTSATADIFGKTESQACAGHTVRVADDASTFRGDDSMEVYLR